ncbi:MAG: hypothetical protein ACJ75B_07355 [Flavisolibacter sp.]
MKTKPALLCLLLLISFFPDCRKKQESLPQRTFYMGVTPWPSDFTTVAQDQSYSFIQDHCDFVSHHFDEGIPYEEAWQHQPFPQSLVNDLNERKQKTAGKKILLSVSALDLSRHQKAGYYSSDSIPDSTRKLWQQLPFNDPKMVAAYTNFLSYMIDLLQPSFVNYGVESNEVHWVDSSFAAYKDFLSQVYAQMKTRYPQLPFFLSFMVTDDPRSLALASQLLPYSDYITLSAYPYATAASVASGKSDPSVLPADFFTRFLDLAPAKPWAIAETGFIAQDLVIPSLSLNIQGNVSWQEQYLDQLCTLCENRKAKFLVWFCSADYDAGDQRLKQMGLYQDFFGLWQDTGLLDENNHARPSYNLWLQWMQRK